MLRNVLMTTVAVALLAGPALAQTMPSPTPPTTAPTTPTTAQPATPPTDTAPAAEPDDAVPAGSAAATQPATPAMGGMQTPSAAGTPTAASAAMPFANAQTGANIFASLQANPQFSMLVTALQTTHLDTVLSGSDRQYTLFAPTNAAIEAVPAAQRTALMNDPQMLQRVLLHHVVGTAATAAQIRASRDAHTPLPMADNVPQPVTGSGDMVMLGDAMITQADIHATNGLIHVVNAVVMLPAGAAPAAPATTPAT